MSEANRPTVIAAHGHSILFETYVPLDSGHSSSSYPIDYFVYTAPSRPKRSPSLRRLPTRFERGRVDAVMNHYCKPYLIQDQRAMWSEDIGLLCPDGDGEFTVANLAVGDHPCLCLGELAVLHHTPAETDMKWEVKQLPPPVPCDGHDGAPNLLSGGRSCSWQTDIVIPFELDGRHLCWVDLYLGLLFVDVIAKHPPPPRYARLPVELDQRRLYIDAGAPDPARRACVTDAGIMQLISINNDAGRSLLDRSCSGFNITTWTFDFEPAEWHKVVTIRSDEFWAALDIDKRLPHLLPEFPTMSMVDPNDVCFTLEDSYHNFWLVNVNIKNKVRVGAAALYINGEEEEGRTAGVFYGNSFITSQFTRYMDKDAIRTLEMSMKLQQAKQERIMENMS